MKLWYNKLKRFSFAKSLALAIALSLSSTAAFAGDPFRSNNPHNIDDKTEEAFQILFREGNYKEAKTYLSRNEYGQTTDPLAHALRAAIGYTEKDKETLRIYGGKTLVAAERLQGRDPFRGNLYTAVGHFLEGAYIFETEGAFAALPKLQKVFHYFGKAEKQNASDPELNLIQGYMELLLAVNLPFADIDKAIANFQDNAAPDYLVNRGIAVAYRDLEQYDKALPFVDRAMEITPNNPELYYLKAQILHEQGREKKQMYLIKLALQHFDRALEDADQLPPSILKSLRWERNRAKQRIDGLRGF